jgi:hypothetical protein
MTLLLLKFELLKKLLEVIVQLCVASDDGTFPTPLKCSLSTPAPVNTHLLHLPWVHQSHTQITVTLSNQVKTTKEVRSIFLQNAKPEVIRQQSSAVNICADRFEAIKECIKLKSSFFHGHFS